MDRNYVKVKYFAETFDAAEAAKRAKIEKRLSAEKDMKAEKDVAMQFGKWSKVGECNIN